jgi:hypothetical protein
MATPTRFNLVAAHELDAAFVIAMMLWAKGAEEIVTGGGITAAQSEQTELLARALSNQIDATSKGHAANVVERLATLGIKVSLNVENKESEVTTTKEFYERMSVDAVKVPKICIRVGEFKHCKRIFVTHLP